MSTFSLVLRGLRWVLMAVGLVTMVLVARHLWQDHENLHALINLEVVRQQAAQLKK